MGVPAGEKWIKPEERERSWKGGKERGAEGDTLLFFAKATPPVRYRITCALLSEQIFLGRPILSLFSFFAKKKTSREGGKFNQEEEKVLFFSFFSFHQIEKSNTIYLS